KYFIEGGSPQEKAQYWSGLHIIPILLLNYVLLGIYMNLSIWYKLTDQTRFGLYISGIGAAITIVLNIILIPRYSYVGAVWVTAIAYAAMVVTSYLWGQQRYPIPYRVGKNGAYIIVGIAICWLAFDVFDRHVVIGDLLFAAFALTAGLIERKPLMAILKK